MPESPGPAGCRLVVLSGPSGVGKGTVAAAVRRLRPDIAISVSVTTRAPRPGEVDGTHYRFVGQAEFERLVAADEFLEHAKFSQHWYGTPRAPVFQRLAAGLPTLLEIDLQGARQVRTRMPEAALVFLAPPSWDVLEQRLRGRGTEPDDVVARRLAQARVELAAEPEFDTVVINDDVERAAAELIDFVESACGPTE